MNRTEQMTEAIRLVPLGPWIERAQAAKIPYIPAEFSPAFPTAQIVASLDGEPTPEMNAAWDWASHRVEAAHAKDEKVIVRWECCCDDGKKMLAVDSGEWSPMWTSLTCDDERVIDCTVGETTRLCVRPWQTPYLHNGNRVEFRVFYGPTGFLGLSNYYPQFALPEDDYQINRCIHTARVFASRLNAGGEFPAGFTADFMMIDIEYNAQQDNSVIFLEGGPPHWNGMPSAHPCAFAPGFTNGIAYAPRPGALTR